MKILTSFSTPIEAHLAITRLEDAGIKASLRDEYMITIDWLSSNAIGGVKIEVADEDYVEAREILSLPPCGPGLINCPHCGSVDIYVHPLSAFGAICLLLKLPIPLKRATVGCRNCRRTHSVNLNGHTAGRHQVI